jgi:hypothetical protein
MSTLQFRRLDHGSERVIRAEDAADGLAEPVGGFSAWTEDVPRALHGERTSAQS